MSARSPPPWDPGGLGECTVLALWEPVVWSRSPCPESSGMLGTQPDAPASLEVRIFGELGCFSSALRSLRVTLTSPSRGEARTQGPRRSRDLCSRLDVSLSPVPDLRWGLHRADGWRVCLTCAGGITLHLWRTSHHSDTSDTHVLQLRFRRPV